MRVTGGQGVTLLLAGLLTLPAVLAGSPLMDSHLSTTGPLAAQGATTAAFNPLALLAGNTSQTYAVAFLPRANVCYHFHRWVSVNVTGDPARSAVTKQDPCSERTNVRAVVAQNESGWMAFVPASGASVSFTGEGAKLEPKLLTRMASPGPGEGGSVTDWEGPKDPAFIKTVAGPHLIGTLGYGRAMIEGGGLLKVKGSTVLLESDQGAEQMPTGDTTTQTPTVQELDRRWVTLEYDAGTVTLDNASGVQIAATAPPTLAVAGSLDFSPLAGWVNTTGLTYSATGSPATMNGTLRATLTPTTTQTGDAVARVDLTGSLDQTTLKGTARAPFRAEVAGPSWAAVLGIALAAVVCVGAATYARRHRRTRTARPSLAVELEAPSSRRERAEAAAMKAEEAERMASSAHPDHVRSLRETALAFWNDAIQADDSNREHWEAYGLALARLDHHREALAAYARAMPSPQGTAEAHAALSYLLLGDFDAAEGAIVAALEAPDLLWDIPVDVATGRGFEPIRDRPRVRAALDRAKPSGQRDG